MHIDTVIMVDWSARSAPSPAKRSKDAIFIAERSGREGHVTYCRSRDAATDHLTARVQAAIAGGRRAGGGGGGKVDTVRTTNEYQEATKP